MKLRRRALAVAIGLVAACALAEGVARIDALFPDARFSSSAAQSFFAARALPGPMADLAAFGAPDPQLAEADLRPTAHPYVGWTDAWTRDLVAEAVAWERGPDTRSTIDLWVFGGSVAAGFGNLGAAELGDRLALTPGAAGRRVRVWNFGRASWREPQPQFLLEWLLQSGARPDVVLVLHGFNEIVYAAERGSAGTHPLYPAPSYWTWVTRARGSELAAFEELGAVHAAKKELRAAAALASDMGWHHSAFLTRIGLARVRNLQADVRRKTNELMQRLIVDSREDEKDSGSGFDGGIEAAVDIAVAAWVESARSIHASCAARGIASIDFLQPTLLDPGSKTPAQDESRFLGRDTPWSRGVLHGYPLARAGSARLAAEGCRSVDLSGVFREVEESVYADVCHLHPLGNSLLAVAMSAPVAAALADVER